MLKKFLLNFVLIIIYEVCLMAATLAISEYINSRELFSQSPGFVRSLLFVVPIILFALPIVWLTVIPYLNLTPRWMKALVQNGREGQAVIVANHVLKGVGGYEGPDIWVEVQVRVIPAGETPFDAQLTCRLSQSMLMKPGNTISVKYDPEHTKRVILVGDILSWLHSRQR